MTLRASLVRQLENPTLTPDGRAELRCQVARDFEEKGDYEAAREAMGELWRRVGEPPNVEGLEASTAAEVLLRAGVLTGWIGSCNQIEGAQEEAKNLISESVRLFESRSYVKKILEAQTELAYCYWRQGEYNEARIILEGVLERLTTDSELRAKAVLRLAIVEWGAGNHHTAHRILTDFAPLFDKVNSDLVKGGYHNQLAVTLVSLSETEKRRDYLDRALIEHSAASFHFAQAGHMRYLANVENNLGFLFYEAGKYKEAHEHLDRARRVTVGLKDKVHTARVDETRACVFLAQGQTEEAERVARAAVRTLEQGGQLWLLAEALMTHARALARLQHYDQSRFTFLRAIEAAQQAGAGERAGEAALAMVKELGEHLTAGLIRKGIEAGCVLGEELKRYERELIRQALRQASGRVTRAAQLLGVTHQYLSYLLDNRHPELMTERTPIIRRRRAIIKKPE